MRIRIKADASCIYIRSALTVNWEWAETLEKIESKILEVETDCLFKDQFNTVPIPNVSESGLRIMQNCVEEVIDDIRPQKMKCGWCGKVSGKGLTCEHCDKRDYYIEHL